MKIRNVVEDEVVKKSVKFQALQNAYNNLLKQYTTLRTNKVSLDALESERKAIFLKDELRTRDKKYEVALNRIAALEHTINTLLPLTKYKPQLITINKSPNLTETEAVAIGLLSDVHCASKVEPKSVNFLNEYNPVICKKRLSQFFKGFLRLVEIQRHGVIINEALLYFLGDFIHGYIHEEYKKSNFMSPSKEIIFLFDILISGLTYLKEHGKFKHITIICQEGNHGRTTDKIEISTAYENSFEWILYQFLARHFEKDKIIKFIIPESILYEYVVFNKTIRSLHGHEINYHGGVGGLDVPLRKALGQWDKGTYADYTFLAHWHTFKVDENFVVNGSVIGQDAYSIRIKADYRPPQQAFVLIDNKRGKTIACPIFLDRDMRTFKTRG